MRQDWVVVKTQTGELRLLQAMSMPAGESGMVLIPVAEGATPIDAVVNAPAWSGTKRRAHFRSGFPCIRCDGVRRDGDLRVALISAPDAQSVAAVRQTSPGSWEFRLEPAPGAALRGTGSAETAPAAFDAVMRLARENGWKVDAKPSAALDS